jgi:hypothetical protein
MDSRLLLAVDVPVPARPLVIIMGGKKERERERA